MEYYICMEDLQVGYHGQAILNPIRSRLDKGEFVTLLGPTGAGKSTVVKSIARQLKPVGGVVLLGGKNLADMSGTELSRNMAVVLTEKLQTELMTCEDVVATGRYPYTGRFGILSEADEQAVEEAMELVHVTDIRHQDFTKLSDGQRQRIMLARAICQEPEIIILDEPTSYLDIRFKLEFLSTLQNLQREKKLTVIMSLHELDLAAKKSDKIHCIDGTREYRYGSPSQVFEPGYLSKLFSVSMGSFDEEQAVMELEAPRGPVQMFVIAGGGTGRAVYRRLQRQGIPFAAGILFEQDLDYPVARALAAQVIRAKAFEPIGEEVLTEAKRCLDACSTVICCRESFGTFDRVNQELLDYAEQRGKKIERVEASV